MSHGTKRSPAHLNTHKNAAKKGAPMANPIPQLFSRSVTNSEGVVLLKPCFSSNTKVEYIENGRVGIDDMKYTTQENATDCRIFVEVSECSVYEELYLPRIPCYTPASQ